MVNSFHEITLTKLIILNITNLNNQKEILKRLV
jgi:hypothetical protein